MSNGRGLIFVAKRRLYAYGLKGRKCAVCNERRWYVMDFHHVIPKGGTERISWSAKFHAFKAELENTVMLCANCHREAHYLTSKTYERMVIDAEYDRENAVASAEHCAVAVEKGFAPDSPVSISEFRDRKAGSKD